MALALWAMVTVVAPIAGPILGGWITDSYSWPWIFFINVPIGIFAVMVVGDGGVEHLHKGRQRQANSGHQQAGWREGGVIAH